MKKSLITVFVIFIIVGLAFIFNKKKKEAHEVENTVVKTIKKNKKVLRAPAQTFKNLENNALKNKESRDERFEKYKFDKENEVEFSAGTRFQVSTKVASIFFENFKPEMGKIIGKKNGFIEYIPNDDLSNHFPIVKNEATQRVGSLTGELIIIKRHYNDEIDLSKFEILKESKRMIVIKTKNFEELKETLAKLPARVIEAAVIDSPLVTH